MREKSRLGRSNNTGKEAFSKVAKEPFKEEELDAGDMNELDASYGPLSSVNKPGEGLIEGEASVEEAEDSDVSIKVPERLIPAADAEANVSEVRHTGFLFVDFEEVAAR